MIVIEAWSKSVWITGSETPSLTTLVLRWWRREACA